MAGEIPAIFLKFRDGGPKGKAGSLRLFSSTMAIRLSSFLSHVERRLAADDPVLKGGTWDTSRTLNYNIGLGRLSLGVRPGKNSAEPLGAILVQAFDLADGSTCLKVSLSWAGREDAPDCSRSIFEKSSVDWDAEASQIAATWLAGPPAGAEIAKLHLAEPAEALAVAS